MADRNTKKLIIYQHRKDGSFFIHATKVSPKGYFVQKNKKFSIAHSKKMTDKELGSAVREVLKMCD